MTHLPLAAVEGLRRLEKTGVRVIAFGETPSFDDFGKPLTVRPWTSAATGGEEVMHGVLARELTSWNLKPCPRARRPGEAVPAFGVETRGYETKNGVQRIALCNQLRTAMTVDVGAAGRDLITGKRTERVVKVASRVPMFIELEATK